MQAHNLLFWISLGTGVVALGAVTVLKIARGPDRADTRPAPDGTDQQQ